MNTIQDNPYKGLDSYEEADGENFCGRKDETEHVLQLVEFNFLSVIFGKSGIGKTSLLNAGVFPRLREEGFLPIRLRLIYSKDTPLLEQIHQTILNEITCHNIKVLTQTAEAEDASLDPNETLWEYFHRVNHCKTSEKREKEIVTPVLVFDQFEELFTLGKGHKDKENLIDELYWLIENQYPTRLKKRILKEGKREKDSSLFNTRLNVRVIIGLGENYLPNLNDLKARIPSIDRTLFRVNHLNGVEAREIITKPGVFQENLINEILKRFYPENFVVGEPIPEEDLEVEPVFLSLLCQQLYEKPEQELKSMTKVEQDKILEEFYNSTLDGFPEKVREFIESKLLTEGGFRTPLYLDPDLPLRNNIEKLVDHRILRKTYEGKREYIEIIHDVLARIIKNMRKKRMEEEKRIAEKKKLKFFIGLSLVSIIGILIFIYQFLITNKQFKSAQVSRLTAEALLEFPHDSTGAIRIAEIAYKKTQSKTPAHISKTLSYIGYSSFEKPFYITNLRHNGPIYSAVFSPDGTRILTASEDGIAKIWDLKGNVLAEVKHDARVMSGVFSPDGSRILTISWDKTVKLWDMKGTLLLDLKHDWIVSTGAFSYDGQQILTASRDGKTRIWSLDGKVLSMLPYDKIVSSAVFSTDNQRLLTAGWDKTVKVWDIKNEGKPSLFLDLEHKNTISSAVFSPDGQRILSALEQGTLYLWNLKGELLFEFEIKEGVSSAIFSPDGQRICTTSSTGDVKLWNLNGKLISKFKYDALLYSASFSPDGYFLVTTSEDGTAKVWNLQNSVVKILDEQSADMKIALYSPDGSRIFTSAFDGTSKLWTSDGIFLYQLKNNRMLSSAAFSPDGKRLLTTSQESNVKIWDMGKTEASESIIDPGDPDIIFSSAMFSSDGKQFLTTSQGIEAKIQLWNLNGQFQGGIVKTDERIISAVFSPDGLSILTVSMGNTARLLDIKGNLLKEFKHNRQIKTAVFSPDSEKILTASTDCTAIMWTTNGKKILELKHKNIVTSAVFSADGREILTASNDKTAKLWDLHGNLLADLDKHTNVVNSAVFTPDGRQMLTASRDGTVKIWFTPRTIFDWLKMANIAPISEEEKNRLEIQIVK